MATKVSLYLDERTADRLRRRTVRERGTLRSLSKEIEELVTESFVLDELEAALVGEDGAGSAPVSFGDVRPLKVSPGPSVTQLIREEREHRHAGTSRRKRRP